MNTRRVAPLLLLMVALSGVIPALAITWSSPAFPFYASYAEHGAMYFTSTITADSGNWTSGLLSFYNFQFAGSTAFTHIGFAAQNDTTFTLLEAAVDSHLLMTVSSTGAARNITIYLPVATISNVTGVTAYHFNAATHLLEIQSSLGVNSVRVNIIGGGGSTPVTFIIPEWFINLGGSYFGVTGIFTSLITVMTAFALWFASSVAAVASLIFSIASAVFFVAGTVIYWFGLFVAFWINIASAVGDILNGTSSTLTGLGNIWNMFNFSLWGPQLIPLVGTLAWIDSIIVRSVKQGRGNHEVLISDLQTLMWVVGTVWEWSWTIFNFVYGTVMTFVSLLWSLIP